MHNIMTESRSQAFWRGAKESLPILLGFIPVALVLGAQGAQKGLGVFEMGLLTAINFAGGSEFTAVSLWSVPVNIGLIVAMSVLVNSRHVIMGAAFTPLIKNLSKKKALSVLFLMCDEAWAMGLNEAQKHQRTTLNVPYYFGVGLALHTMWWSATALGAFIGPVFGDLEKFGFDMAFTAIFLVLLKGMWRGMGACYPWFVSLVVAGTLYHTVEGAWYVAGGALAGIASAALYLPSGKTRENR